MSKTVAALATMEPALAQEIKRRLFAFVAAWAHVGLIPLPELVRHPIFAEAVEILQVRQPNAADQSMLQLSADVVSAMGRRLAHIASCRAGASGEKEKQAAQQLPPLPSELNLDASFCNDAATAVALPLAAALQRACRAYDIADVIASTLLALSRALVECGADVARLAEEWRACLMPHNRAVATMALEFCSIVRTLLADDAMERWRADVVMLARVDVTAASEVQGDKEVTLKSLRRSIRETVREIVGEEPSSVQSFLTWARDEGAKWRAMAVADGVMSMQGQLESLFHAVSAVARTASRYPSCDAYLVELVVLMAEVNDSMKGGNSFEERFLARTIVILMGVLGSKGQWLCSHSDLTGRFIRVILSTLQLPEEDDAMPFREGEDHCGAVAMMKLSKNASVAAWIAEHEGLGTLAQYLNAACSLERDARPLTWRSMCLLYKAAAEIGATTLLSSEAIEQCASFLFISLRTAAEAMPRLSAISNDDWLTLIEAATGLRVVAETCAANATGDRGALLRMILRHWPSVQALLAIAGSGSDSSPRAAELLGSSQRCWAPR